MPELPEVETIRGDLEKALVGRRIAGFETRWPRAVAWPDAAALARELPGLAITGVHRRGKYLLIALSDGRCLICHLRMTGRLLIRSRGDPEDGHVHTRFALDEDGELRFSDARKFGRLWLVADPGEVVGSLGPEPFDPALDGAALGARLAGRRGPIKPLLLDQRVLAGVGNIYACEALHRAGIDPRRRARGLAPDRVARLARAVVEALRAGIDHRGTTLRDFVGGDGAPGEHVTALRVYRRDGLPCPACGAAVRAVRQGARSTFLCPRCQR
ncbi:MAG: bifunctional DNA-formamidopyrimidine glycosylase/DNA-(apurinic or apyrimidinic site) lyase [Chloroflexi bacterium]|nr:bifunctional DNA-formamidopyrimidine glycosylase/DNA-(apurinic or apyrimidinic site) lyase [Chloroflexota bacterium]